MPLGEGKNKVIEKEIDVVAAGHICLDMFPEFMETKKLSFEDLFVPGKITNVGGMRIFTGGPVSNTGIAMQILGARVSFIKNIKKNKNFYCINIAHFDKIENIRVGPKERK